MRLNGGVIGEDNSPSGGSASGVWGWPEQELLTIQNRFPLNDGLYLLNNIPKFVSNTGVLFALETIPQDLAFSEDGSNVYMVGNGLDNVYQFTLGTAWDTSTISYSNVEVFSVATQEAAPSGLSFKPDGTTMYVVGTASDRVNQYNLTQSWNIASAVFNTFISVLAQENAPSGVAFKPDGTRMYVIGTTGDDINQYSLSDSWNVASASFTTVVSLASQDTAPTGVFFKPEGDRMFIVGSGGDNVYQYSLSESWNIASLSYTQSFSVGEQESAPSGVAFKPDGTRMYVIGSTGDDINEYSLSSAWDFSMPSYTKTAITQDTAVRNVRFKPDGTKMYILGQTGDNVYQYSLSSSWDVTSLSYDNKIFYVNNSTVTDNLTLPLGLTFSPDGSRMFVSGTGVSGSTSAFNNMSGFTLSTPWDVSTASFNSALPVFSSTTTSYTDHYLDGSGTRLFFTTTQGQIRYVKLLTPWNLTTNIPAVIYNIYPDTSYAGLRFSDDGKTLYLISSLGQSNITVYNLKTAWDLDTLKYSDIRIPLAPLSDILTPFSFYINNSEKKLYVAEASQIAQINLG
jgi:sugar lactone lactonase YvrE